MSRSSRLALAVLVMTGCRPGEGPAGGDAPGTGQLELSWPDSAGKPVRFAVPATGRWCASDSLLEIMGARHDTAIGIVLLASDTAAGLGLGPYAVMPAKVFIPWRPRAIAALRMAGALAVEQFESVDGQVTVTAAGREGVSGRLDLRLIASVGLDSLRASGRFEGVRIVPASPPCGRFDRPAGG